MLTRRPAIGPATRTVVPRRAARPVWSFIPNVGGVADEATCDDGEMNNRDDEPLFSALRVWIFHGEGKPFASGVFGGEEAGLEWIARHGLTGILTEYEVGDGCYDLAVRQ